MLGFLFWCGVAIILLVNGWIVSGSILALWLMFVLICLACAAIQRHHGID